MSYLCTSLRKRAGGPGKRAGGGVRFSCVQMHTAGDQRGSCVPHSIMLCLVSSRGSLSLTRSQASGQPRDPPASTFPWCWGSKCTCGCTPLLTQAPELWGHAYVLMPTGLLSEPCCILSCWTIAPAQHHCKKQPLGKSLKCVVDGLQTLISDLSLCFCAFCPLGFHFNFD